MAEPHQGAADLLGRPLLDPGLLELVRCDQIFFERQLFNVLAQVGMLQEHLELFLGDPLFTDQDFTQRHFGRFGFLPLNFQGLFDVFLFGIPLFDE